MDETNPPEDLVTVDVGQPDQTDNDSDAREHSPSPQRESTESEITTPPAIQEVSLDSGQVNSSDENSELDERPSEANGDTGESESSVHQHPHLATAAIVLDSASSFICKYPGCHFTSVDAEAYLKHEDTHVEGGSALCDICNIRFPTYANMRRHHLYMHQGIRTFECQFCTKRFLRKEQFMEHLVIHTKPRPYQCSACGATFNFRGQLKVHLSSEHPNLVDRTCNLCDFKTKSPNAARLHYATFHVKHNEVSDNDRPQDLIQRVQVNPSENGAIDLATVSQNFSFMGGHYQPYLAREASVAGPSDLSRTSKFISVPSIVNPRSLLTHAMEQASMAPMQEDDNRHMCVTSLAGSTTVVGSPCQERSYTLPDVSHVAVMQRGRVSVKPEPPELAVDDSQSNVQPTSTMDLSSTDVVETTSNEAGTSETPCRRKVHKHSVTDDTGSESGSSPPNRHCHETQTMASGSSRTVHTCCRFRPYDDSGSQRCREFRHTCAAHRHSTERRQRLSDDDRNAQNDQSDEERKVFYSRATSTNLLGPGEVHAHRAAAVNNENNAESHHAEPNYYNRKNTIVIRDIESCTLTCVYCGIIFPDQTLYLLHRSLHSESSPWKCNLCGKILKDKYDFNSHVISKGHY